MRPGVFIVNGMGALLIFIGPCGVQKLACTHDY